MDEQLCHISATAPIRILGEAELHRPNNSAVDASRKEDQAAGADRIGDIRPEPVRLIARESSRKADRRVASNRIEQQRAQRFKVRGKTSGPRRSITKRL